MNRRGKGYGLAFAIAVCIQTQYAQAERYGFYAITNNDPISVAIGEAQFRMQVTAGGDDNVSFRFYNLGPARSSITDIYFDDAGGSLADLFGIQNGPGVSFAEGAEPPDLPGWDDVSPVFTSDFDADSDIPAALNGVNSGEWVRLIFQLADGVTFADIIEQLSNAVLRVGIQGRNMGGSGRRESFINRTSVVPLPGAFVLGAVGLGLVGVARGRLKKS